jgi:hypothetical protein
MADESDDELGYRKPPKKTRFKKGKSGNPKGRPKGSKNMRTVFQKELNSKIPVKENGKSSRITKREAIVKQAVNKAASGDPKAMPVVFNEVRAYENGSAAEVEFGEYQSVEDLAVISNLVARIRASAPAETPIDPISANEQDAPSGQDRGQP